MEALEPHGLGLVEAGIQELVDIFIDLEEEGGERDQGNGWHGGFKDLLRVVGGQVVPESRVKTVQQYQNNLLSLI